MKKKSIALLTGGNSSEREVALRSARQIADALDAERYAIYLIDVDHRSWTYRDGADNVEIQVDKNDFSLPLPQGKVVFDFALIIIHGTPGENGLLQGYLDIMQVPYSSCSMISSAITFDKITCKRAVASTGVGLAREVFLSRGDRVDVQNIVDQLGLPLFVKPNASGSSFGVTKVRTIEELLPAVEAAFGESDDVLIEEMICGREMGCGVMITPEKEYLFPITEIVSKNDFFDYQAKYTSGMSNEITPADLTDQQVTIIHDFARKIYRACRCSGIVRVDFILTDDNRAYMIEVNSIPGMSAGSIVPKQVAAAGMTMRELWQTVIDCKIGK